MYKYKRIISMLLVVCLALGSTGFASAASPSDLQYSTYVRTPANYNSTNCYGYAIGRAVAVDPGYYSSRSYSDASTFRQCILMDLRAMGYSARVASSPSATLASNEVMIAYCYGTWRTKEVGGVFGEEISYHFWLKGGNNSAWSHKFGRSSGIMNFNYTPSNSVRSYMSDEYYNGITGEYNPASFFASTDSATVGYIIFDFYGSSSVNRLADHVDPAMTSGELDHSIAALIESRDANAY